MSNPTKYNEEQFSMRSLESAYLPHMFSESGKNEDNEDAESFDSISSTKHDQRGGAKSSTNVSFIEVQSITSQKSRRMDPYTIDKNGMQITNVDCFHYTIYNNSKNEH